MSTATVRRRRSTQAERRAETRAALLDATIECLVSHGYARTTTGRIAELAGVSRGAQLPYFRSRADIVAAAVAHLAERRIAAFEERFKEGELSTEACLDALWDDHQGDLFAATLELWVASRTDAELRKDLVRIERRVGAAVARFAAASIGDAARRPDFGDDLTYVLATIRGLAMLQVADGSGSRALAERWRTARGHLLRVLS